MTKTTGAAQDPGAADGKNRQDTASEHGVTRATYTDVRTFDVTTSEQIKKPPPG